jgi:hypothetical protein
VVFDTARDVLVRLQPLVPVAASGEPSEPAGNTNPSSGKTRGGKHPSGAGHVAGSKPGDLPTNGGGNTGSNNTGSNTGTNTGTGEADKRGKRALDTTNPFGE